MRAIFLPTAIVDVEDALEESTLVYIEAYDRFLKRSVVAFFRFVMAGALGLCVISACGLLFLASHLMACGAVAFLVAFLWAGGVLYGACRKYIASLGTSALAKIYFRLDILPFDEANVLVCCEELPAESFHYSRVDRNSIKESLLSLKGDLGSFEEERRFLRSLADIANAAGKVEESVLSARLLRFSEVFKHSLGRIIAGGIEWSDRYRRYIDYYRASVEGGGVNQEEGRNAQAVLIMLGQDLKFLSQARQFLVQQGQKALGYLHSLQGVSPFSMDVKFEQVLAPFLQVCESDIRTPIVRHLMFETREGVRRELGPKIRDVERRYRLKRDEIVGRYRERIIGAKTRLEEARARIQDQLDECRINLRAYQHRLQSYRDKRKQLLSDIRKIKRKLSGLAGQVELQDRLIDQAARIWVSLSGEASEEKGYDLYRKELARFEVRMERAYLSDRCQQLEAVLRETENEIEGLIRKIREEEERIEEKQRELQNLEMEFQTRHIELSEEKRQGLHRLEQSYRAELQNVKAPLMKIESHEESLSRGWISLIDQVDVDKAVECRYLGVISALLEYRRRAARSLYERALRELDRLRTQVERSEELISSLLWPRVLFGGYDAVFIPVWLLLTEERSGEKIVCLPVGKVSEREGGARAGLLEFLPGLDEVLYKIVETHYEKLKGYIESRSILADTMYLKQYLPRWIGNYRRRGRIGWLLSVGVLIDLFGRRISRFYLQRS